jgi:L-ascorbate metabolism protein UlaG (beta-lactamase superfamily)
LTGYSLRFLLRREPEATHDPGAGPHALRFLGTAGFVVEAPGRTLVLDPFLSRPSIAETLFGRLVPDEALLARELPQADEVLVGHSHHDHALDAPAVCRNTGARLLGSVATANIGRAYGLPEGQIHTVSPRVPIPCGPVTATALPSHHGRVYFGRVPFPGDIARPPRWPPKLADLRHGAVYTWLLELGGATVAHVDSADYLDEELRDRRADILCLCAIGRHYRQDYTRGIVRALRPKVVVPCHWDDFTLPFDAPPRQLPGVDVDAFVGEITAAGARAVVLGLGQTWRF